MLGHSFMEGLFSFPNVPFIAFFLALYGTDIALFVSWCFVLGVDQSLSEGVEVDHSTVGVPSELNAGFGLNGDQFISQTPARRKELKCQETHSAKTRQVYLVPIQII